MKRCYSLKKKKDFQFTYRVGKSVGCYSCTLIYAHDRRKKKQSRKAQPQIVPHVRVGFSVSKKVGNSVARNRAKRRLREAIAPLISRIRSEQNLIFIARPAVLTEDFLSLRRQMEHLLLKADLLREDKL